MAVTTHHKRLLNVEYVKLKELYRLGKPEKIMHITIKEKKIAAKRWLLYDVSILVDTSDVQTCRSSTVCISVKRHLNKKLHNSPV